MNVKCYETKKRVNGLQDFGRKTKVDATRKRGKAMKKEGKRDLASNAQPKMQLPQPRA